ncbi:MAG: lipoyl(octanoyl) transferase LipB [Candidatus Wallbacteria bacterium]|nr:lipoyl(octanoyl) transferase LipB [Candidatus Wallbacteria bacterium]
MLDLGRIAFQEAWALQQRLFELRGAGRLPDTLLLAEHPPTITLGRSGRRENLLLAAEAYAARGIELVEIDRGGDVTYHGPGQLVGYPILDLSERLPDVHRYVRALEEVMLHVLAGFGIAGARVPGMSGVWCGSEKVGAVGVKVKNWVTMHGFALNVDPRPDGFELIVPCGIRGKGVTSLARLLARPVDLGAVRQPTVDAFAAVFGATPVSAARAPELTSVVPGLQAALAPASLPVEAR